MRFSETKAIAAKLIQAGISVTPGDAMCRARQQLRGAGAMLPDRCRRESISFSRQRRKQQEHPLIKSLDDPVFLAKPVRGHG